MNKKYCMDQWDGLLEFGTGQDKNVKGFWKFWNIVGIVAHNQIFCQQRIWVVNKKNTPWIGLPSSWEVCWSAAKFRIWLVAYLAARSQSVSPAKNAVVSLKPIELMDCYKHKNITSPHPHGTPLACEG